MHPSGDQFSSDLSNEPLLPRETSSKPARNGSLSIDADGHTYTYTYGPTGLSGLLHNHYAFLCAIFASIGGLSFGYDQGVVSHITFSLNPMS